MKRNPVNTFQRKRAERVGTKGGKGSCKGRVDDRFMHTIMHLALLININWAGIVHWKKFDLFK